MKIIGIETGAMRCKNYLLSNEETGRGILIDCGGNGEAVILEAKKAGVTIDAIFLTHGHADHIEGAERVVQEFSCPVYLHQFDLEYPKRAECNLSMRIYSKSITYSIDPIPLRDEEELEIAGLKIKVIHTPGHTQGSVCFLVEGVLFTGDTLFLESVGGDFPPYGNFETELESIRTRLYTLEQDYTCYPGHGPETTLSYEMKNNIYCRK